MSTLFAKHTIRTLRRIHYALADLDPAASPSAFLAPSSEPPRENIVVFPGSFNPPTVAHLALLQQAHRFVRRQIGHWQIYAALSKYSINKETVERMTLLDRVALLDGVLKERRMRVGILLLNKGLYVEQARGIRAAFPQVRRLFFLLGFDKIVQILDPCYYDERDAALYELFRLAHVLVAPRGVDGESALVELLAQPANRPFAQAIRPLPLAERYRAISSSQARQQMDWHDIPALARDFLWRTHPYDAPTSAPGTQTDRYAQRTQALQTALHCVKC